MNKKESENKIDLVYIVSSGRSGSTLLELLLNTHPSLWTVGELNILPWELEKPLRPCGCGEEVKNCEFWSKVISNLDNENLRKDFFSPFRETRRTRKVLRLKNLYKIIFRKKPSGISGKFCEVNINILKNTKEEAKNKKKDIEFIVSSSKGPYRLFWLNNCKNINVKAIHIIKDPRAFVYSNNKRLSGFKMFFRSLRMIFRYIIENWVITKVSKTLSESNFKIIRYEELASNPKKTMKEIADWLGVEKEWNFGLFREKENHGIGGNIMRFKSGSNIILDEKWKSELDPFIKKIVTLVTYFPAKKYGYFK